MRKSMTPASHSLRQDDGMRTPYVNSRLAPMGTTIFAEMSALAAATGSINLGQGFPDTDGPQEIKQAAAEAVLSGLGNQYPPGPGVPELRAAVAQHQKRFYGWTSIRTPRCW
jgi:N-succinyldiaminopimelate aminotransferase